MLSLWDNKYNLCWKFEKNTFLILPSWFTSAEGHCFNTIDDKNRFTKGIAGDELSRTGLWKHGVFERDYIGISSSDHLLDNLQESIYGVLMFSYVKVQAH